MGCFLSNRTKEPGDVDELAFSRCILKAASAWPENQNILNRIFGAAFRFAIVTLLTTVTLYVLTEAPALGIMECLRSVTDILAHISILVKDYYIRRSGQYILKIRKLISEDFKDLEKALQVRPVRLSRQCWPWTAPTVLILMVSGSFVIIFVSTCMGREHRTAFVKFPQTFINNDFIYFPFILTYFIFHYACIVLYVAADGLYISFTSVLRDKTLTLSNVLKLLSKRENPHVEEEYMISVIRYHQLIFELHEMTERMLNGAVLAQVFLALVSIAVLLIRVLYVDMSIANLWFNFMYFMWVVGQLVSYCVLGDAVTASCSSVSNASYRAYAPGMPRSCTDELRLMLLRAQRPLRMTAKKLVTMNKKTFMEIMKRSYSIFSALAQMK